MASLNNRRECESAAQFKHKNSRRRSSHERKLMERAERCGGSSERTAYDEMERLRTVKDLSTGWVGCAVALNY